MLTYIALSATVTTANYGPKLPEGRAPRRRGRVGGQTERNREREREREGVRGREWKEVEGRLAARLTGRPDRTTFDSLPSSIRGSYDLHSYPRRSA